jgi:membrane peptidoglycan carboxypeptidase
MSNNWRPVNNSGQGSEAPPRSGNLLRDYNQSQQHQPPMRVQEQRPVYQNQYSPVQNNNQVREQYVPQTPPSFQAQPQQWAANAMQMMRRWSGKMAAQHAQHYGQPEPPMVLRHPPQTPLPVTAQRAQRWKRSRTIRIAMQMRHRRDRWHLHGPNGGRIGIGILIAVLALVIIITSSTSAYAYSYYQSQLPHVQSLANQHVEQITRIYDRNGVPLGDLFDPNGAGRRTVIQYKDLPQVMKDAMIAAEDKTFWTNSGVDPLAIIRTATGNIQAQGVQGGASTLTQQLIKNLTHDTQQTADRKLTEAALAIGLTQQYPKWKIMEMYFNVSPFGTLDLGVEAAAEEYFHLERTCDMTFHCTPGISKLEYDQNGKLKPILGLARAALLAGMPQSPVSYDPTNGKDARNRALIRQNEVLHNMLNAGMSVDGQPITEAMIQQAEALTAKMTFTRYQQNIKAPHFFNWVAQQLAVKLGHGDENAGILALYSGGFNIRTTIDTNLEDYVEKAVDRHLNQPEYQPFQGHYAIISRDNNVHNSAVVVMNAQTGEILAMDGSADYNATADKTIDGQFNAATDALRSPGSTWKPIVYATAFEMGMYPGIVLPDFKTYFSKNGDSNIADTGNMYVPPDYGNGYSNTNSSIRVATANSRNVPAVKAAEFAGIDNVANTARRFGVTDLDKDIANFDANPQENPTHIHHTKVSQITGLASGLGSEGVSLLQMTGAYQVFANQGVRVPPQGILDIWDNYGHQLYHYDTANPPAIRVISPQIAYLMTSVLADEPSRAPEFGNDHVLSFNDWDPTYQVHQVAAKTGTTDQFVDNWTMGYTSKVVVGVWSGNSDNSPLIDSIGITGAAPIWHSVMERVSGKPCDPTSPTFDNVPCGAFNAAQYNFIPGAFPVPTGVHQAMTSSATGLKGGGTIDWMLDGEDPTI